MSSHKSMIAWAWTWATFWEGWLFGHFLSWWSAVAWTLLWLAARGMYELGKSDRA